MQSNFAFLKKNFPILAQLGEMAESYLYSDTNSCLMKLGMMGEAMVHQMLRLDRIPEPSYDNTHAKRIKFLKKEGLLPKEIEDILHALRMARNKAVHVNYGAFEDGKTLLQMAYSLAVWFEQTYGDWSYLPDEFVMPEDNSSRLDYEALLQEKEAEIQRLLALNAAPQVAEVTKSARVSRGANAAGQMKQSEAETRYLIDEQLRKVGWEVDTVNLHYAKGTRPEKGHSLAIAEWPTGSRAGNFGKADYALFVGLKLVGIIEAKAEYKDVPSVIDYQCKEYAKAVKSEHKEYQIGSWGHYKLPFVFATNGRPYLKQLETKSGIWFLDLRDPASVPKALQGWMSPAGLLELLEQDKGTAEQRLKNTSFDLLREKNGLGLREYQIRAIEAAEKAILEGRHSILLSMATGTGKTRTVLGMIYRFLQSGRFRRILFLVDRTALGEQAQDVFKEVKLEDLMTLNEIYTIKELDDKRVDRETKVQVATVQSLIRRILGNEEDETMPAVSDYDLIVVDEAHRGYTLDKEMGEDELAYRDQADFRSKYRMVIEYFNAVKVALTATPALHTTEIFGKPVFNYSYREAVIDGFLVDHDAPHTLGTKLSREGIHYSKGETVAIYDPVTGEVTNSAELEDELHFDVDQFNRQVITEAFNRTVLREIAQDINPEGPGKTLIYAVDDQHADLIVKILKEIFGELGVDNDAVMKITGSVGGGNPKKVLEAVKRFKNELYPTVAVTVDLLTTGVDVPEIDTLVFLRRVKSRILFEQMLGRATRLCDKFNKTHFEIYDPVGVYESLEPVSTMKPVAVNAYATFGDLLDGLEVLPTEEQILYQIELILAKLQRKKRNLSVQGQENFAFLSGGQTPGEFNAEIRTLAVKEAQERLLNSRELLQMLDEGGLNPRRKLVVSVKEDELLYHTRGYGNGQKPEDYLEEFTAFITGNMNEIASLNIVCTRPQELTRETLKSLRVALDGEGFTEQQLNTAIKETTNAHITADIIGIVRRYALGSPLISHEERIRRAVEKLRRAYSFNRMELDWLARIESYLMKENVLDPSSFESGAFKNAGGYPRLDKIFKNQLDKIILELNNYLYDDGGNIA
ncbi:type I restriction-modification system endonuclease [Desulfitobacterium hafniense]|uniref:type I restriction-modification system endonuclease n=1 Tax=Desulfitobacterium hafniense TaxID=49338 RepID=UPI000380C800|nr:type I restriction-modification system endonuclease [Desulfitobacterium hafniense]